MSVVNQMLRDLENNQAANQSLKMQAVPQASNGLSKILIALLSIAVLLTLSWLGYQQFQQQNQLQAQPNIVSEQPKPVENIKTPIVAQEERVEDEVIPNNQPTQQASSATVKKVEQQAPPTLAVEKKLATKQKIAANKAAETTVDNSTSKPLPSVPNKNNAPTEKPVVKVANSATAKTSSVAPAQAGIKTQSLQTTLKKQLEDVKQNYQSDGYLSARQNLMQLLDNHPDFHPARNLLFKLAKQSSEPNLSNWLQQAVKNYPKYSAYRLAAARYHFERNDFSNAEQLLTGIDRNYSNYFSLVQMRALTRQKLNKHQLAILDYGEILKQTPNRGDVYLAMGISFDAMGNTTQAKRSFQNAMSDSRLTRRQLQFAESKINSYQG